MNLKSFLITMTFIAVVSDYLLHPFYPQFFELRFGMTNPKNVGYYFAAICFMVMIAFPFWAYVSKRVAELKILIYTQAIAGVLALYCYWTESYINFWIVSLVMVLFKGSYLLVYPYILKIIKKEEHTSTIGLLSVVVHLGGILGAVIGGFTVDFINPSSIFLVMALGDFLQMSVSAYLLKSKKYNTDVVVITGEVEKSSTPNSFIIKIGLLTLILYFSDFLIRPFFSLYWESFSSNDSKLISGTIYAIPGFVALIALWINNKRNTSGYEGIIKALLIGLVGLSLQGIPSESMVIIGRIIYGWAIFQGMVKFDVFLFEMSSPESYSIDYSKIHFFQNFGVLLASLNIGLVVDNFGLQMPFILALSGFIITLLLYFFVFKFSSNLKRNQPKLKQS
ncbi:Predicted arabinose efflux permease, MFS family [Tenacibaculum sp. MAR_2009_124]|uniref:MFS transporter n=1 Tax=Tenacibaculum sp. MAR_2009_124 TaxID=1250059 RepID=UPI0008990F0B|nr:MFS transporter [Tenacibaculum sp. MAR_2009_124]SEB44352.1 Predicted arabinose efflux permease, MFS family [Tenacibaculum sp. MAR_2009_124]